MKHSKGCVFLEENEEQLMISLKTDIKSSCTTGRYVSNNGRTETSDSIRLHSCEFAVLVAASVCWEGYIHIGCWLRTTVVQAVRPRAVIAPLQLGLSVQMHHLHRSGLLIDSVSTMGFASSYPEVQSLK